MAQTVHLKLQIGGNDIVGESTTTTLDREDTIECSSFTCGVEFPRDENTGALADRRLHSPVTISKRIDQTTPLLLKALCEEERVEAEFRFYRPAIAAAGTEEHFYTISLGGARISSVEQQSLDAITGGVDAPPMMEEVSFVFYTITWTYPISGATHRDTSRF
ncbi:type VI secretion system tube protein TssD [Chloroflexota bacterium]